MRDTIRQSGYSFPDNHIRRARRFPIADRRHASVAGIVTGGIDTAYNLEVEGYHNYYASGVLVHDKNIPASQNKKLRQARLNAALRG